MSTAEKRRPLLRKLGRWFVRGLVILIGGLIALVLLAMVFINLPPGRNFVRNQANSALADMFTGKLVIDHLGYVGFDRIGNLRVSVFDARGRKVLSIHGASARASWPGIVLDALRNRPLSISIEPVRCDHIEVTLIDDGTGSPTLASAFSPKNPTPSKPDAQPVSIHIPDVAVRHIWAHGDLQAVPVIDGEIADLVVAFSSVPDALNLEVKQARLVTRGLPSALNPSGRLRARAVLPAKPAEKPRIFADFDGKVAGGPTKLHAELVRNTVKATLSAKGVPARVLRDQAPTLTLTGGTDVELSADGKLPALAFRGRVENEALNLDLRGNAELDETKRASVNVQLRDVNLQKLMTTLPASALAADTTASATIAPSGELTAQYTLTVHPGRVQSWPTPLAASSGTVSQGKDARLRVDGTLRVDEPGANTRLEYQLRTNEQKEQTVGAQLSIELVNPPRVKSLAQAQLKGTVNAVANMNLSREQLDARLNGELLAVSMPPQQIRSLRIDATAKGALSDPELTLSLKAKDAVLAGQKFRRLDVDANGGTRRLNLNANVERSSGEKVALRTHLRVGEKIELDRTQLKLSARDTEVDAHIARTSLIGGSVRVSGFALSGAGTALADGSFQNGRLSADFSMESLNVPRLMRLAGIEQPLTRGVVSGKGKVSGPLNRLRGSVQAEARDLDFKEIRGGRFKLDVKLDEKTVNGSVAAVFGLSNLKAEFTDVDLPPATLTRAQLANLRGAISANGVFDLGHLAPTLRALQVPIEQAQGQVTLDLRAENPRDAESAPTLDLKVKTHRLKLVEQRDVPPNIDTPATARAAEPRGIEGVDFKLAVAIDAHNRDANAQLEVFDKRGTIFTMGAETKLPELANALAIDLQQQPVKMDVRVPTRAVETWPPSVRPKSIRGFFQAYVSAEGTLQDPKLNASLTMRRFKSFQEQRGIDVSAEIKVDRKNGEVVASADSVRGRAADFTTKWQGDLLEALQATESKPNGFLMEADMRLAEFPVGVVPQLSENQIRGRVSGTMQLRELGRNATFKTKLDASRLRVGQTRIPGLTAIAEGKDGAVAASLVITQPDGGLEAKVTAPAQWGARLVPVVDPRLKAELNARKFQLEALSPLLLSYVSTLEGKLDANFKAEFADGAPKLEGKAEIKNGVVQLPQLGQRLSDVSAKFAVKDGEVSLDSLQARGTTGRLTASARARIEGTNLATLKARVDIEKNEKFPVTLQGVSMGDAWGHAEMTYKGGDKKTEIRVDVPDFHMQMPEQSMGSTQDLAPNEHVRIGFHRQDGQFVAVPVQPLEPSKQDPGEAPSETTVAIHLGDSVWIERGQQAKVQLTGDIKMTSGAETRMDGRIQLRGGKLDVNGKTFDIERGEVSFDGDASNPTIVATARWDSPAGYVVYADYAGTIEAGKLTLRAEPTLTQAEIVSLLLFGSPEGSVGSGGGGGNEAAAVSVAGDSAVKGFNRVMADFTNLDVSARIDTSTGSARPEIVVQVTPRLTTRITRAVGQPAPGESLDRTFLTLELRLQRAWALSAMVGDRGASALDLIWRKRY